MKTKSIVTAILLAFVAGSVIYLVVKETGVRESQIQSIAANSPVTAAESGSTLTKGDAGIATAASLQKSSKIVAYYFHGTVRCTTCRTIEAFAREAIENGFPEVLKSGNLEFKPVNIDESGNEHFVNDYQLTTRTLVLARYKDGKEVEWKALEKVWQLVNDKVAFLDYVQNETRDLLAAGA
jgi:hypothetical protein